ncbi:MAG: PQQ-binding-like beta-propeller repeat protein, partial [Burkholderiales bacterium]|nr:PQQ-binding-like beta-propeller repeat protein [Anaerolineae bacterium]
GWYHPLDFTQLWQMRLSPAFIDYVTFDLVPTLPPVILDSGVYVIANGDTIEGIRPPGEVLWRVQADGVITGIAALSGERVVAHTRNGQAVALQNGRYAALWDVPGPDEPFAVLGETLVFVTDEGGLAAFDAAGLGLWTLPSTPGALVVDFRGNGATEADGGEVALSLRTPEGVSLRLVDAAGGVTYDEHMLRAPVIAPTASGSWMVLEGTQLARIDPNVTESAQSVSQSLGTVSPPPGRTASLTADMLGNSYVHLGDNDDTLVAFGPSGELRWRVDYPPTDNVLPPLMRTGNGCLLYALDADGKFNIFNTANGELLTQMQLYSGGNESSRPRARVLNVDAAEHINIAGGFLTMVTMDGWLLGGEVMQNCRMG